MIHPTLVQAKLRDELTRFGITEARLRRHAWHSYRITRARVEAVLHRGDPGHLKEWTNDNLRDWIDMIRTAWLCP